MSEIFHGLYFLSILLTSFIICIYLGKYIQTDVVLLFFICFLLYQLGTMLKFEIYVVFAFIIFMCFVYKASFNNEVVIISK
jgi:hypothetical protein